MRIKIVSILIFILAMITLSSYAQEYKSFQIENIATEAVWPSVYKAFQELKLPRPIVNKNAGTGETSYYYFTALMIKNRVRFRMEYTAGTLTVSLFGRQYMTDKGWADNMMPMTKKQASNILDPIKDRIIELSKDKPFAAPGQMAQIKPETGKVAENDINKAGIYEDFVIVRTDDPEMDLLAVHKNGNIIGFDLYEDKETVKALVFKENKDSEAITVLFDEKGFPKGIVADQYVAYVSSDDSRTAMLTMFDNNGNYIGNKNIKLPVAQHELIELDDQNNTHGPSNPSMFVLDFGNYLSNSLSASSTLTKAYICAAGVVGATATAPLGGVILLIATCESLYFDLVARYVGKDHFLFNELTLASDILGLFSPKTGTTMTALMFDKLSKANNAITAFKNSIESGEKFYTKYKDKKSEIIIEGPSIIKIDKKNNNSDFFDGYGAITLYAKSNYPDSTITWNVSTNKPGLNKRIWFMHPFTKDDKEYRENYSGIELRAKENLNIDMMNEEGQIIESGIIIEAKQLINGKEISVKKQIEIYNPKYFYFPYPDCSKLFELKLISQEEYNKCSDQADKCRDELWDNGYHIVENDPELISLILDEHILSASGLTDPNMSIDSKKLNFLRKLWKEDGTAYPPEEAGQLREFVKPAPCMGNWYGLGDKQTIIILAHEAMDKMRVNEDKIKTLEKAAELVLTHSQNFNDPKVLKIAEDINALKESSKKIRAEYGDRINKIAEKRTIQIASKKSDTSKCYTVNGFWIVGAHWNNSWLVILTKVDLMQKPRARILNDEQYYESAGTISFNYFDRNGVILQKGTSVLTQFAMSFDIFEKTDLIDFHSSESVLSKKPYEDELNRFHFKK